MKDFQEIPKSQIFTREQLKAIRGGDDGYYGGHRCDDWRYSDTTTCLNCCLTVHDINYCDTQC